MVSMECTTSSNLWMRKVGVFAKVGVVWAKKIPGSLCSPIAPPPKLNFLDETLLGVESHGSAS